MTPEELKALFDQIKGQLTPAIKLEINEAISGLLKADELAGKLEAAGLKADTIETLTKAIETQGLKMNELFENKRNTEVPDLKTVLVSKKALIEGLANGTEKAISFEIPIKTLVQTSLVGGSTIGQRLPDIGQIPTGAAILGTLFRHAPVEAGMNKTIRYIDRTTSTSGAAGRSEGAVFGESAIAWTEYSFAVPEIADSIPVTKESFRFISFIQAEIERLLSINMAQKEDTYYWDGTGVAPISKGVYTYATAFDYVTYAAAAGSWLPAKANIYDLFLIMKEQISNGKESKYLPNLVLVNPGDSIQMFGTKDVNGNYVKHPLMNGNNLAGMTIIETSQVDKGTALVCDNRFATIYDAENMTIEMGYVGDQFKEGKMTLRAYKSTGILVRNSDAGAFLKCADITAALAAINAVTA